MSVLYNEIDPFAAAWLRELIKAGHIADGVVDERSIADIRPDELTGFTQCHFFAGIGVWSHALRQAGWDDERPVWTGSCPCQPFSAAGKRGGVSDERHLWPHFFHLIEQCRPVTVFGEQVASKDGLAWLDTVQADMENAGYAVGAADLCASGFGAPHIRQRLYFVANSERNGREQRRPECEGQFGKSPSDDASGFGALAHTICNGTGGEHRHHTCPESTAESRRETNAGADEARNNGTTGELADTRCGQQWLGAKPSGKGNAPEDAWSSKDGIVADTEVAGLEGRDRDTGVQTEPRPRQNSGGATNGFWANAEWLPCRDGKARAVESGTFPLAYGATNRVGRLRGYGNAIVAPVAEEFVRAYMGLYTFEKGE